MSKLFDDIEQARKKVPRVLFIAPEDKSASWQWRVAWPCEALSNHGYIADWCVSQNAPQAVPFIVAGRYNIVVTPRLHFPTERMTQEWANLVHGSRLPWVYEVDDDGWAPDIAKRQASLIMAEWNKGELQLEQDRMDRIYTIQQTDAAIVSSEPLAKVARSYTDRPVFCIPNLIHSQFFDQRLSISKRQIEPITVGWSGGLREDADLENVAKAWTVIAERYPQVKFIVHGVRIPVLIDALPPDRVTCLPWTALPDYPRALMNLDIACCSVAAGREFNECKTPIKWMEATLSGATCVVSKALYGQYVRDGKDALVAESPEEWVYALSRLIDDTRLRRRIQKTAKQQVLEQHSIERNWQKWVETLGEVVEHYQLAKDGLVYA